MANNLGHQIKVVKSATTIASGTDVSVVTEIEVAMAGFESCCFIFMLGAIATSGVITCAVKGSDTTVTYGAGTIDRMVDPTTGASTIVNALDTDDDGVLIWDVFQPGKKFLRAEHQRTAGNVTIEGVIAILYNGHYLPTGVVGALKSAGASMVTSNPTYSAS